MWPLQTFMQRTHLQPGDELVLSFDPVARSIEVAVTAREPNDVAPKSREQQRYSVYSSATISDPPTLAERDAHVRFDSQVPLDEPA